MTTQTNIPTNNLGQLLQDIDRLQVNRRPLAPHAIANGNDEDKKTYATILAVLMVNQSISDAQSRLLTMLLHSMDLDIPLSSLYDRVSSFDKQALEVFCELVDRDALAPAFFMDALTLLRLDKPLSEVQVKSLSELTTLLEVPQLVIEDILHLSNKVLHNGDKDAYSVQAIAKAKFQLNLEFDYDSLKPWHEFSYRSLTEQDLESNELVGAWVVTKNLVIEQDLTIKNCILMFSPNTVMTMKYSQDYERFYDVPRKKFNVYDSYLNFATIKILELRKERNAIISEIQISSSYFINSSLWLEGTKTSIKKSYFISDQLNNPAITFCSDASEKIEIYDTKFEVKNNCAVDYVVSNYQVFLIDTCNFENCGSDLLKKKGAVTLHDEARKIEIKNCNFIDNRSKNGSGIYLYGGKTLNESKIENCRFINNDVQDYPDLLRRGLENIVINLAADYPGSVPIENCYFKNAYCKIEIGYEKRPRLFRKCLFHNSSVLVSSKVDDYFVFDDSKFENNNQSNLIVIPNSYRNTD